MTEQHMPLKFDVLVIVIERTQPNFGLVDVNRFEDEAFFRVVLAGVEVYKAVYATLKGTERFKIRPLKVW